MACVKSSAIHAFPRGLLICVTTTVNEYDSVLWGVLMNCGSLAPGLEAYLYLPLPVRPLLVKGQRYEAWLIWPE